MPSKYQSGQKATGRQAYGSEVRYFVDNFSRREVRDRIKGLFADQIVKWIIHNPSEDVAQLLAERYTEMSDLQKENWAWALTQANKPTFERFVDREHRIEWLNSIIEAEIERENTRGDRIGYVNQRKQELS